MEARYNRRHSASAQNRPDEPANRVHCGGWNFAQLCCSRRLPDLEMEKRFIRVGDEILEVTQDLSTVVDAVGVVGNLLK
jgi:hypothetical protein